MKKKWMLFLLITMMGIMNGCQSDDSITIKGKILSAGETSLLIEVIEGSEEDLMQVHITDDTKFAKNIPSLLEKNKIVTFTTDGKVMESYPVQVYALRILEHE